jgi:hypothetical protein
MVNSEPAQHHTLTASWQAPVNIPALLVLSSLLPFLVYLLESYQCAWHVVDVYILQSAANRRAL